MTKHFNKLFFPKIKENPWVKKLIDSATFKSEEKDAGGDPPMGSKWNWIKERGPFMRWLIVILSLLYIATYTKIEGEIKIKIDPPKMFKSIVSNK
jgi:hypothetical protein